MTAETLAAALLRDVPRYVLADGGGMKEDAIGAYVHWHDLIAALSRALDPALTERAGEVLEGVTPGPWTLCAHLANDNENGCTCGYRGVIYAADTEYAVCQPGHEVTPGEEGLEPPRLPRAQEVANARFIAWARNNVPALLAQNASLRAERDALEKHIEDTAKDTHRLLVAAEAKVEKLRGKIRDWEARIDACEWSTNSSLTEDIRAEMRAALTTEERK